MMDDDLRLFERTRENKLVAITAYGLERMMHEAMKEVVEPLISSVVISTRFMNFAKPDRSYVVTQSQAILYNSKIFNDIMWDPKTVCYEDTFRLLSLFKAGYLNVQLGNFAIDPGKMNTPGGLHGFRNTEVFSTEVARTQASFGDWVGKTRAEHYVGVGEHDEIKIFMKKVREYLCEKLNNDSRIPTRKRGVKNEL